MKRVFFYIIISFSLLISKASAQNLVLNPSFEDLTIDCCDYPLGTNPYLMLQYWTNANNPPGYTMADLNHRCLSCAMPSYSLPDNAGLGSQNPRTGDAFGSQYVFDFEHLPTESCEYIQGVLFTQLEANRTYVISIWVSLADLVNYTYSNYSVYFTNSQLNENSLFLDYFIPQVTTATFITETENWQNIKIQFTAQGGEKYFSFGTFLPYDQLDTFRIGCADYDSLHPNSCYDVCYVYLDDVAIYPADAPVYEADAGGDQLLCKGERATLGSASRSQYLYWWYDEQGNLIDT
ncbi:MAG: hypothetical protein RB294_08915, partial [Bacteroidales bacterium]|nr:hypothetical protein [Bacteroidales bacterium]